MSDGTILAWHFSGAGKRLGYEDGRQIRAGRTLKVDVEPMLCVQGLHASVDVWDALKYAPGPYLWRVEMGGTIVQGKDKLVATERKALWGFDATDLLRTFARQCALSVAHLWDCPDLVRRYLESGDESIRAAARNATSYAARVAAWAAARNATSYAARAAAWDAAWDAAGDAAWVAARVAARFAARAAAGASQNEKQIEAFRRLVAEQTAARPARTDETNKWL